MKSFINFYRKASKVSGKCLVKYSFTVLRYFQKKQAFYKAYTHWARLAHYFPVLKTIFQVQARWTLEHFSILLTSSIVLYLLAFVRKYF